MVMDSVPAPGWLGGGGVVGLVLGRGGEKGRLDKGNRGCREDIWGGGKG